MSILGWIATIGGAVVGTTLFEVGFNWLFGTKNSDSPVHPSQDPGYQSRKLVKRRGLK